MPEPTERALPTIRRVSFLDAVAATKQQEPEDDEKMSVMLSGALTIEDNNIVIRCSLANIPTVENIPVKEETILREKGGKVVRRKGNLCFEVPMPSGLNFTFADEQGNQYVCPAIAKGRYGSSKYISIGFDMSKPEIIPAPVA